MGRMAFALTPSCLESTRRNLTRRLARKLLKPYRTPNSPSLSTLERTRAPMTGCMVLNPARRFPLSLVDVPQERASASGRVKRPKVHLVLGRGGTDIQPADLCILR